MGKIVMPKNSALLNEVEAVLEIYYKADGWIPNDEYKSKLKMMIGDDQYSSSYTKKAQITSYFGFTEWEDIHNPQSKRRITQSGKNMYQALLSKNEDEIQNVLMNALETVKFGRGNFGCPDSDSDVEPPSLFIRSILDLGYLTYREFAFLLWKLEDVGKNYTDAIREVSDMRKINSIEIGDEAVKYTDCKPIMVLVRWGFLAEDETNTTGGKHIIIKPAVLKKFEKRLRNLKIYNIDKNCEEDLLSFSNDLIASDNETRFREWLTVQATVDQPIPSASTIRNNCKALKEVFSFINIPEYSMYESIYDIIDINIFSELDKRIRSHIDFSDVNKNKFGNGFLSSGLSWYKKYLVELAKHKNTENKEVDLESNRVSNGTNILLYGVPGSGKSWTIQHEYCDDESKMERLVFHPDYTYSNFIGQILPDVSEGIVNYRFTPGPFTNIMKKAYEDPEHEYFLIIEEINRGNAPAIFGEVFQLLDRKNQVLSENDDGFPIGTSEYGITNTDIANEVYGDPTHKVRIPSNLSIIGTMNTSDQNVFTLDTAFQRRWSMRLIESTFTNVAKELKDHPILDSDITWEGFCEGINNTILRKNARVTSSEDKRIGPYFIHISDLEYDPREKDMTLPEMERIKAKHHNALFAEKVIKYLWDDAFKFSRADIFRTDQYYSLEQVLTVFARESGKKRFSMFKDEIVLLFEAPFLN